jgi:hypothetical protein
MRFEETPVSVDSKLIFSVEKKKNLDLSIFLTGVFGFS